MKTDATNLDFKYFHIGLSVPRKADVSFTYDSVWAVNHLMDEIEAVQPAEKPHDVMLIAMGRPKSVFEGEVENAERLARVFHKNIVWFSDLSGEGVAGVAEGDHRIFVNINSDRPLNVVAGHELAHWMKTEQPDVYARLKATVLRVSRNTREYKQSRAEHYQGDRWKDEFVADFMGEVLSNPIVLEKALGNEPSLVDKVASFTLEGIKRIKEALHLIPKPERDASVLGAISDMKVAQEAVVTAVRTYAVRNTGYHFGAVDRAADFLYAGQSARGYKTAEREGEVFPGKYDGKPRFEISDQASRLKTENMVSMRGQGGVMTQGGAKLKDVLDHPALYRAYPEMRDVNVALTVRKSNPDNGIFLGQTEDGTTIKLDASSADSARRILLHEVQHWIQDKEDFARGDNPDELSLELRLARLKLDRTTERLVQAPEMVAFRQEVTKRFNLRFPEAIPDVAMTPALVSCMARGEEGVDQAEACKFIASHPTLKQAQVAIAAAQDEYHSVRSYGIGANAAYLRSAGEIESRDVAKRADYTDEQRERRKPYASQRVPVSEAFVVINEEVVAAHRMLPQGQSPVTMINEIAHALKTKPDIEEIKSKLQDPKTFQEWESGMIARVLGKYSELSTAIGTREESPLGPVDLRRFSLPITNVSTVGVSLETAKDAATTLSKVMQNVEFAVVKSADDLQGMYRGMKDVRMLKAEGLYDEGKGQVGRVVLVADNINVRDGESPAGAAMRVGFHEAAGHHGIRRVLGDKADETLVQIWDWAKTANSAEVRSVFDAVTTSENYKRLSKSAQADEVLARLQETRQEKELSFWGKAMGALCTTVRQHLPDMRFSEVECEYLLHQARNEAKRAPDKEALFRNDMLGQRNFFAIEAARAGLASPNAASFDQITEWSMQWRAATSRLSASGELLYSLPLVMRSPEPITPWEKEAKYGDLFRVVPESKETTAKEGVRVLFEDVPGKLTTAEMVKLVERYGGSDSLAGNMIFNAFESINNGLPEGYSVRMEKSATPWNQKVVGLRPEISDPNGEVVFSGEAGQKVHEAVCLFASKNDLMGQEVLVLDPERLRVDQRIVKQLAAETQNLGFDAFLVSGPGQEKGSLKFVSSNNSQPEITKAGNCSIGEPFMARNENKIDAFQNSAKNHFAFLACIGMADKWEKMDEAQAQEFEGRLRDFAGETMDFKQMGRVVFGEDSDKIAMQFAMAHLHSNEGVKSVVNGIADDVMDRAEKEAARKQLTDAGLTPEKVASIHTAHSLAADGWTMPISSPSADDGWRVPSASDPDPTPNFIPNSPSVQGFNPGLAI
jgi:hypothetical protein